MDPPKTGSDSSFWGWGVFSPIQKTSPDRLGALTPVLKREKFKWKRGKVLRAQEEISIPLLILAHDERLQV